jgi:broad specificity phosphatase PhoE
MLLPTSALSQTRRRTTNNNRRSTRATSTTQPATETARAGAERVAEQIKNLTRFLYLLGGVARSIETADDAARRGEASSAVQDQTARSKATVKTSLQNVRVGLDKLETDFRASPELQRYYINLAGSAAGAATAEEQAAAGQYDQAGRSLLGVVNRLTDVLLEMH